MAENDDIENDDEPPLTHQADSRLEFKFPADGDYVVRLRDAQRKGGPEYAYRLSIAPERPDFDLQIISDSPPQLSRGETAVATVAASGAAATTEKSIWRLADAPKGS